MMEHERHTMIKIGDTFKFLRSNGEIEIGTVTEIHGELIQLEFPLNNGGVYNQTWHISRLMKN